MDLAAAREAVAAPMTDAQAVAVIELLLSGSLSDADGAGLLVTWAERGETGSEVAAVVRALQERAVRVAVADGGVCDVCGTGGSGVERFNISTTVSFVLAALGIPVAKHGNRGSRRPNGSFDLLEALGIPIDLGPEALAQLHRETGLCFLFARSHHPAVGKAVPYRKAAGRRTIFNLSGPLANPSTVARQLVGTTTAELAAVLADALQRLAVPAALVVWGEPGIDEISVTGRTDWLRVSPAGIEPGAFTEPLHPGLDHADLPHGDASENVETFTRLLQGDEQGPLLDMLCINAGAAIDLWRDRAPAYVGEGAAEARAVIASGAAWERFCQHRDLAQQLK